jgi:ribosomal protein S9
MSDKKTYTEAIGRRKTSTARVRLEGASKTAITINGKEVKAYFPSQELMKIVMDAFTATKPEKDFAVSVKVTGGGQEPGDQLPQGQRCVGRHHHG